jgi:hypothetical protein
VFAEQKTPGTLDIWGEPFTFRRVPLFFNPRMDPYERAQITSNSYYAWTLKKAYFAYGRRRSSQLLSRRSKNFRLRSGRKASASTRSWRDCSSLRPTDALRHSWSR